MFQNNLPVMQIAKNVSLETNLKRLQVICESASPSRSSDCQDYIVMTSTDICWKILTGKLFYFRLKLMHYTCHFHFCKKTHECGETESGRYCSYRPTITPCLKLI